MSGMLLTVPLLLISALFGVDAFMYRALPVVYQDGKVSCIRTSLKDPCTFSHGWWGYRCEMYDGILINPLVENCDIPPSLCVEEKPEKAKHLNICVDYTYCQTLSGNRRVCYCGPDYMGNPYQRCKHLCETDVDCPSPMAACKADVGGSYKYCQCIEGRGDGVTCTTDDICKLRKASNGDLVCVQSGKNVSFVCPEGLFMGSDGKCHEQLVFEDNKVFTITIDNFNDGYQIIVGKCLSMIINGSGENSTFAHVNSGDPISVDTKLSLVPTLFLAFEFKAHEIIGYAITQDEPNKLTRLYTVTNTAIGCKLDQVQILDEVGKPLSDIKPIISLRDITSEVQEGRSGEL
ncbi:hypothetical protein BdWA1_002130 [Babesia duncani]|uniref:12D3 antigen n=1 Tax=Babesia duncani TaxID=323732 RepID=A0AAD9PLR3_9APIC|nr:hypothetical protein BdWA1_002130 [Babesia duncani]